MFVTVLVVSSRKAGISPAQFRHDYEEYIAMMRDLTGSAFPLCHRRTYITQSTVNVPTVATSWPGSNYSSNSGPSAAPTTPSSESPSQPQSPVRSRHTFDYDVSAELTFESQRAYERFIAKVKEPAIASRIHASAVKFMESSNISLGNVYEVMETRRIPEGFTRWEETLEDTPDPNAK
ncbi:hypothetical protein BDW74DRAFT_181792 [Aspergillus multicolor]|uniref:uncharacterized protein n=1 Tax=Aspergillus multicolor TaxID=41759 RepID=UPI003CCD953B